MKRALLYRTWIILLIQFLFFSVGFAQHPNDNCANPALLIVGNDAATCRVVAGDTRGTEDATTVPGPEVCSSTWYTDDVWYNFVTEQELPENGITVEVRLDPNVPTDFVNQGMAIYSDCDQETLPLNCFSNRPGRRTMHFPLECLMPNTNYLVRIWSASSATDNAGTFSICAYESPVDTIVEPRVIYEETFDTGLGAWTSVAETETVTPAGETFIDDWLWTGTGCLPNYFGLEDCMNKPDTECGEIGMVGFPAGWYQSKFTEGLIQIIYDYSNKIASLVSPPIDLSNESCVELVWTELYRGFNGSLASETGSTVEYSLDNGETWLMPSQAINTAGVYSPIIGNYFPNNLTNTITRRIPLLGAGNKKDVRIRFRFVDEFYHWLIDDIKLVEAYSHDLEAQANFIAPSTINPMSIYQLEEFDFMIDIVNLACEDQTNVNVNVLGTDSNGLIVHDVNLAYGTIASDSFAENQSFLQPFMPPQKVDDYTFTYSISSDVDNDLSNNTQTFNLQVVNESVFRKEDGVSTLSLNPDTRSDVNWSPDEPYTWEVGNVFHANSINSPINGGFLGFNEVSFQLANPQDLVGELIRIWLYEIDDKDFDGIIDKDDNNELRRLGISEYQVTGLEEGLITVELFHFGGSSGVRKLDIVAGKNYLVTLEYVSEKTDGTIMRVAANDTYNYSVAYFNARQNAGDDYTKLRYGNAFAITKENYFRVSPGTTNDFTTGNFNEDIVPIIRLGYDVVFFVSAEDVQIDLDLKLSPNPASNYVDLNLSQANTTDIEISILNLEGKEMTTKSFQSINNLSERFDVSTFDSGVYIMHVKTPEGFQSQKFIVVK